MAVINAKAKAVSEVYQTFRTIQTQSDGVNFTETKAKLKENLASLNEELNNYLAKEYGIDIKKKKDYEKWLTSHQPFHWFTEFYSIINNGGFDVIIGNPPYVEYSKVKKDYEIKGYETEKCGNLYGFVMERSLYIHKKTGRFGIIVPVSCISLEDTQCLRDIINDHFQISWISGFAVRPSKLFEGVEQRLIIYLSVQNLSLQLKNAIFTTSYYRWSFDERNNLFYKLQYIVVNNEAIYQGRIPKLGSILAFKIIENLFKNNHTIANYLNNNSDLIIHYHRSPGYWIRSMNFEPYFQSSTSNRSLHHFRDLKIINLTMTKYIGALLNSSLFFVWFDLYSNNRNIAGIDVKTFPIGVPNSGIINKICLLFDTLMESYQANSEILTRKDVKLQQFYPSKSKSIIDEIDKVLAQHYGFSEEELDFIINYDIKYRMGKELDSD
jgi:hypothetical protein